MSNRLQIPRHVFQSQCGRFQREGALLCANWYPFLFTYFFVVFERIKKKFGECLFYVGEQIVRAATPKCTQSTDLTKSSSHPKVKENLSNVSRENGFPTIPFRSTVRIPNLLNI